MTDYRLVPVGLLSELAESLAWELDARYPASVRSYESQDRKYQDEMEPVIKARQIIADSAAVQGEPEAISDADILAIAGKVESCPVSPWWLKDDVAVGDVRAAVLRFARALLVAAPQPAEQQPVGEMISNDGDIYWTDQHPPMGTKLYTAPQPAPDVTQLVEALEQIERWDGFPPTDEVWEDSGEPVSYGAAFGSNGERDFMREVARKALAAHHKGTES